MGTNYYIEPQEPCPHCKRGYPEVHIGKSSAGWVFSLHVDDELDSWDKWLEFLEGKVIRNEYGNAIPLANFIKTVTCRKHIHGLSRNDIDGSHCVGHGEGTYDYIAGDFS
jgi:hypothetical protein